MNATLDSYRKDRFICGANLAKTAGSSLAGHAKSHLDEKQFFRFGRFSRVSRFLEGQPQLEDLPDDLRDEMVFVFGHGVQFSSTLLVPDRLPDLMIAIRHPVSLFRSRFFNHVKRAQKVGKTLSFEEWEGMPDTPNRFCSFVVETFGDLGNESRDVSFDNVTKILKHFRYVFVTEQITDQVRAMWATLGLPEAMPRLRVTPEKLRRETPDLDESSILKRHSIDLEIFELLNTDEWRKDAPSGVVNTVGFEEERLRAAMKSAREAAVSPEQQREQGYRDLVDQIIKDTQLEAALLKFESSDMSHVRDAARVRALLEEASAKIGTGNTGKSLDPLKRAMSKTNAGNFALQSLGQRDVALQYASEAFEVAPGFKPALGLMKRIKKFQTQSNSA